MTLKRRDFLKLATAGSLLAAIAPDPAEARIQREPLPPNAQGILYDATLCVGCQACMVGYKQANNMPPEPSRPEGIWDNPRDLSSRTLNVIKKYENGSGEVKDRETDGYSFIKRHCMHCVDPSCVSACPVSALRKDPDNGVVTYDKDACIGCRYCQVACPFNIPKFEWDNPFPLIVKCQLCSHLLRQGGISACCAACPTGASLFGPVEKLLEEAKRRLAYEPGSYREYPVASIDSGLPEQRQVKKVAHYMPHIYGANEVGGTQVLVMAGVPFDLLGLPELPEDSFVKVADGIQYAIYKGMVYPLVVLGALVYLVRKSGNGEKA